MGLEETPLGETVNFTQEDLNRAMPFEDVKVGETVQFGEADLQRAQSVQTPQETQSYYLEKENRVIDAPVGMQENEIVFSDHIQNNNESEVEQFFGFNKLFEKTADVVALPFKGAAATFVSLGATGEAGARLKIADAIKQGLEEDLEALRRKVLSGEKLTDEEARALLRDTNDRMNPIAFLTRKPEDIVLAKVKKAIRKGDVKKIEEFRAKEKTLRESVGKIRINADNIIEKHFAKPTKEESVLAERILYDFGGVTTSIGVSIGLAVVTKNPVASVAVFSELQNSSVYLEARDAGIGVEKARAKALLAGNVEGALEFIGVNYFFKIAENSTGVRKHILRMGEEAMQEFLQSGAESIITQTSGIREVDVRGALEEAAYSAFLGSLGGGTTSLSMGVLSKRVEKQTDGAVTADLAKNFLEKVLEQSPVLEGIVATEIETEVSGMKGEADAASTKKALSYLEQFATGKPIDISKLDRATFEALTEMRDANADKKIEQIEAQEGTNFLAVPKRPKSLSQFLKEQGGLKVDTFEAQRFTRKEAPDLKGVANKNGKLSLDEARELAVEAGFLRDEGGEGVSESDVQGLLDALEAESLGADVVSELNIAELEQRNAILDFNEQRDIANQEIQENARAVKSFKQTFKEGVRLAKKDVKAAQEAAIEIIETNLPEGADRAKFIKAIKNIDSAAKLRKAAPDFERRIERILTDKVIRVQKARIKKLLSKKKLQRKPQAGKRVGKFDAATQERLEYLQELYNKSGKVDEEKGFSPASEMLETFLKADAPDPLANAVLQMKAAPQEVSAQFIGRVADSIEAIQKFGLEEAEKRLASRHQEAKEIRAAIDIQIDPKGNLLAQKRRAGVRKAAREKVAWAVESWNDYIDRIAPAETVNELEIGGEISNKKRIVRVMNERMVGAAKEAFGGKNRDVMRVLDESSVPVDIGVFKDMNGDEIHIEYSRAQARKLWMEYQNEKLREKTIQHENGNAYTDQMLRGIFDILTPEDIHFAEKQLEIYEGFYEEINEVYSRVFGINLPKTDFYSPISRDVDLEEGATDQFGRETNFRRSLAGGSALKLRDAKATSALSKRSDIQVFASHTAEMAHFIAFREKTMMLNDVFGNANLRRKLNKKFGDSYAKNVSKIIERIAGQGGREANEIERIFNYMNRNFATSVLGGKAKIGLTQMSSYFAYGEFIPAAALVDGTRHFAFNASEAVKILGGTEFLLDRGYSEEADIARMGKTFDNLTLKKIQDKKENLIDYTLIFTKLGDRGAIYLGGWPVYRHSAIEQMVTGGLSLEQASKKFDADVSAGKATKQSYHAKAVSAFEDSSRKTQQSKDVDQMSLMQMDEAVGRTLSMFQSAPFAQFRGEIRAFRQFFFKKEISKKEFGKRFLIYHVLIPQFYRALSNGLLFGEFDEEDQAITLVLGSLNAIPLFSDLLNFGIRKARGKSTPNGGLLKWAPNVYDTIGDGYSALVNAGEGDFELATEYLADTAMGLGSIFGLMTPQAEQIMEGMEDIDFGDIKQGTMKLFGFPDSVAEGD